MTHHLADMITDSLVTSPAA